MSDGRRTMTDEEWRTGNYLVDESSGRVFDIPPGKRTCAVCGEPTKTFLVSHSERRDSCLPQPSGPSFAFLCSDEWCDNGINATAERMRWVLDE